MGVRIAGRILLATLIKRLVVLLIAAGVVGAIYVAATREPQQKQAGFGRRANLGPTGLDLPVPVVAGQAEAKDVPVYLEGVGTARALNTVTVRAQVDGKILRIAFREGQSVKKGDLLAEIDPVTYKAAHDQAVARRALTATQLANARRDLDRYQRIPGVIAQKTVDTQIAQVAQLEAQINADDAAIASAQAILDYTRVLAPIDGRTGIRQVDEGNIVRSAGDTGIVTITQVQPISVLFTLPQQQLPQVSAALAAGPLQADAMDADNRTRLDGGNLQVIDNQVDQTTGTVRMKADFANARLQLWPGQFVNIRLLVDTLKQVVVVPTPAVQRGPTGPFVYVIGAEERVALRPVVPGLQTDTETVLRSGLASGERVVVSGFARLQEGSRVVPGRAPDGAGPAPGQRAPAGAAPGEKRTRPDAPRPEAGKGEPSAAPAAGAAAAATPPASVAADPRARFERIRAVCSTDLQSHCAGAERQEMRACMEANRTRFSPACQAVIAETAPRREAGQPATEGSAAATGGKSP